MTKPFSKTDRLAYERLGKRSGELRDTEIWVYDLQSEVPAAWATLAQDIDVEEPKVKITMRLDESVAKFYRAMGKGYQERMNRVLATYAQMKIARVMELNGEVASFRGSLRSGVTLDEAVKRTRRT